jgi:nucleoside-diphosphate-sugar epimerase
MNFKSYNITPLKLKIIFDFCYITLASIIVFVLLKEYLVYSSILIFLPFIFLLIGYFFNVYSEKKSFSLYYKISILILPTFVTSLIIYYFSKNYYLAAFWFLVIYVNLIIPRIIINITDYKSSLNFILNRRGSILIIGGAGYIGSHLVEIIINSGKKVKVLDNLMYGDSSLSAFKDNPNFELIIGDTTDIQCLTNAMRGVYAVIHLSGLVGDPACAVDPVFTRHQNVTATRMVRDIAQSMGVERLIFSSSCSVYGMSDVEVTELDLLNPVSLYARTKIDSEIDLMRLNNNKIAITILRFATVYGDSPRPRFDLVANLFAAQAYIDKKITIIGPNQWRPFIHVKDLARAINIVLNSPVKTIENQIYNVGDSRLNMTLKQLGEKIKNIASTFNIDLEINIVEAKPQDTRNYAVSFSKIKAVLGFEATILMEEGLTEIIEKFKNGIYSNYTDSVYSNLLSTIEIKSEFYNNNKREKMYAPLSEAILNKFQNSKA